MKLKRGVALLSAITMIVGSLPYERVTAYAADEENKVEISEENFPDAEFREYIKSEINLNKDNYITEQEVENYDTTLNLPDVCIEDVTGAEKLAGFLGFSFRFCPIKKIDFSEYAGDEEYYKYFANRKNPYVSVSTASPVLEEIDVSSKYISSVGINSPVIKTIIWGDKSKYDIIDLSSSNLVSFDVASFPGLMSLNIDETDIKEIDVSSNLSLAALSCGGSEITSLDLSKNEELMVVYCGGCHLQEIDLSKNNNISFGGNYSIALNRYDKLYRYTDTYSGVSVNTYAMQQVYAVAAGDSNGSYSIVLDKISDGTRINSLSSGTRTNNKISWSDLSDVPSTFTYKYDTRCPKNSSITYDVYLDVNVNVVRPANITGITNISGNGVTVNWASEQTEDDVTWEVPVSYEIYRSNSEEGTYSRVGMASGDATSYTDTSVASGNTYYYKVKTVKDTYKGKLTSEYGEAVSVTIAPETAKLNSVTQSQADKAVVSWEEAEGATEYEVYRSESENATFNKIATVTETTYTDSNLINGKTYYYKVMSRNGSSYANAYSSVLSVKIQSTTSQVTEQQNPDKVVDADDKSDKEVNPNKSDNSNQQTTNTTSDKKCDSVNKINSVKKVAYNKLKIKWNKAEGATGYEVYRSTKKNGTYKKVADVTGTAYTDKVNTGTSYYYKVRSYVKTDEKVVYADTYSGIKSGKATLNKPSVKLSVSKNKVTIKWNKVKGANGYEIYMSTKKSKGYKKIKTVSSKKLKYTKSGLKKGKKYYFKVKAYRKVNGKKIRSGFSTVRSIKAS